MLNIFGTAETGNLRGFIFVTSPPDRNLHVNPYSELLLGYSL
jgi:hypothetical protein